MKIVNPIYDKAFKYLMQNERLAKYVLETILDQPIETLTLNQQETVVPMKERNFTLFRLDFKATIKDVNGNSQIVLIELQKSKFSTDLVRFRNYLGTNYISTPVKKQEKDKDKKKQNATPQNIYPIITIYILGYEIEEIPYLAVNVERCIYNTVNKERVYINSDFINHLTHRSYILQIKRLPTKRKKKLEKFLSIFDQSCVAEEDYILDLKEIPEEIKDIVAHLNERVYDEEFRRYLQAEQEIDIIFDEQERKYETEIQKIREKEELANKRALAEKQRAEQKQIELEAEKQRANKLKAIMMEKLKEMGYTDDQISDTINSMDNV